jgi:hypothetical protein
MMAFGEYGDAVDVALLKSPGEGASGIKLGAEIGTYENRDGPGVDGWSGDKEAFTCDWRYVV